MTRKEMDCKLLKKLKLKLVCFSFETDSFVFEIRRSVLIIAQSEPKKKLTRHNIAPLNGKLPIIST